MADDTTDMTTNDVDGAGTASEVVDVPVVGVNAGLFDRPKSEDELAGTAAGGAVAAKATGSSTEAKEIVELGSARERKLLWLLASVAAGGLAFVVLSGGDDDDLRPQARIHRRTKRWSMAELPWASIRRNLPRQRCRSNSA